VCANDYRFTIDGDRESELVVRTGVIRIKAARLNPIVIFQFKYECGAVRIHRCEHVVIGGADKKAMAIASDRRSKRNCRRILRLDFGGLFEG
jgi:hypothetical protein